MPSFKVHSEHLDREKLPPQSKAANCGGAGTGDQRPERYLVRRRSAQSAGAGEFSTAIRASSTREEIPSLRKT